MLITTRISYKIFNQCFYQGFGDNRKNTLVDMAISCGARVFGDEGLDIKIEDVTLADLGQVSLILLLALIFLSQF